MAGTIFIKNEDGKLIELTQEEYESEDLLQSLIEMHPEILAGNQINTENPRKWLLISREMGVPSEEGGGSQWSLDHLLVDQDAIPTFVEVKRSTDTRIRREVVGQMLDYAANAILYWSVERLKIAYNDSLANGSTPTIEDLVEPDKVDSFWEDVGFNLRNGKVRLLFVADKIPSKLQVIIEFLNKQMNDAEVLGVEVKQFRSADGRTTTLVPSLIGATASIANVRKSYSEKNPNASYLYAIINEYLIDKEKKGLVIYKEEYSSPGVRLRFSTKTLIDRVPLHNDETAGSWGNGHVGLYIIECNKLFNTYVYFSNGDLTDDEKDAYYEKVLDYLNFVDLKPTHNAWKKRYHLLATVCNADLITDITNDKEKDKEHIWSKLDEILIPIFEMESSYDNN